MAIPDAPLYLTSEEEQELERQNELAKHSRFHDELKCGPLEYRPYKLPGKTKAKFKRYFCATHQVYVSTSHWEVGWYEGECLRDLNSSSS